MRFRGKGGKFTTPQKAARFAASKKASRTRKARKAGVELVRQTIRSIHGTPREVYQIPENTIGNIATVLDLVHSSGRTFIVHATVTYSGDDSGLHASKAGPDRFDNTKDLAAKLSRDFDKLTSIRLSTRLVGESITVISMVLVFDFLKEK